MQFSLLAYVDSWNFLTFLNRRKYVNPSWQVYGNNVEIQAMCEMYNRPIHIYSYSTGRAYLTFFVVVAC